MAHTDNHKPIPRSILIFRAAAYIGRPLAHFLRGQMPSIRLRLATSHPERQADPRRDFPPAEVVSADYFDQASMEAAVEGMNGIFVITANGTEERPAMRNLVTAVRKAGCAGSGAWSSRPTPARQADARRERTVRFPGERQLLGILYFRPVQVSRGLQVKPEFAGRECRVRRP